MRMIRKIIVHASGKTGDDASQIDVRHRRRGLRRIGFHYVIGDEGSLARGRGLDEAGAHCLGYNADSVGVCLCGTGLPTVAQMRKLHGLTCRLLKKFPRADVVRAGDLDPWLPDILKLDVSLLRKERPS
ncbi:MAG TPA: peptidoglycan recognition family protein [bacterium]